MSKDSKSRWLEVTLRVKDSDTEDWKEYAMVSVSEQTFHMSTGSATAITLGIEEISQSVRAQVASANRRHPLPKPEPEDTQQGTDSATVEAPEPEVEDIPF